MITRFWLRSSRFLKDLRITAEDCQTIFIKLRGFCRSSRLYCDPTMKRNWNKPEGESELRVYNSLTKEKVRLMC